MASTRCKRGFRACLFVAFGALAVLMVGGFVFLGLRGPVPWAPTTGDQSESAGAVDTTGSSDSRVDEEGASTDASDEPLGNPEKGTASGSAGADGVRAGALSQGESSSVADGSDAAPELSTDEITQLIASSEASKTTVEDFDLSVDEAAAELVGRYQAQGNAVLVHGGWLDIFGRCWGCVVTGPGWVDVCLVSGAEESSTAQTLRMEVEEWRRAYGQE